MPRMKFTDSAVRALQPGPRQDTYWDASLPGFGLRIAPAGSKTWTVMYREKATRKVRRMMLGHYPTMSLADARAAAKDALAAVHLGDDPAGERRAERAAISFSALVAEYIERHAKPRKRSWQRDERTLTDQVPATWHRKKAHEVTRRDVRDLLDSLVAKGKPIAANRMLACVRKLFNFAVQRDLLAASPCVLIERPAPERQRERVLSADELRAVWQALDSEDAPTAALFRLALLTAQRGYELRTMAWSDLDLDAAWWTIPAGRSKNKLAHRVPLSPQALQIVRALQADATSTWCFPSPSGEGYRQTVHKVVTRVRKTTGVEFVPHDVRRTVATFLTSELGVSRLVVAKILNHVETGVTRVYDRASYDREKRDALNAWGARLEQIVSGEPARMKVVAIRA